MVKGFRPKLIIKNYLRCKDCNRSLKYEMYNESYASATALFPHDKEHEMYQNSSLMEFYIEVERCDCKDD